MQSNCFIFKINYIITKQQYYYETTILVIIQLSTKYIIKGSVKNDANDYKNHHAILATISSKTHSFAISSELPV